MKKVPMLFVRDWADKTKKEPSPVVHPEAQWVIAGEGIATRKRDGTTCLVKAGRLFRRFDAKVGKVPPKGFVPCDQEPDESGHWPGWVPVGLEPESKWHRWAVGEYLGRKFNVDVLFREDHEILLEDGLYELCGPKFQGNPERLSSHQFFKYGSEKLERVPRNFEGLRFFLEEFEGQGIVWCHPDGRMVKLLRSDFSMPWPLKKLL